MSKGKELAKNTIIILAGKLCTQLITFLMLPLYTNVLPSDEYGSYDLLSTYITLAISVIGLQLEMGLFRFLIDNRKNEEKKRTLISNAAITIFASLSIWTLVYFVASLFVEIRFFYPMLVCAIAMLLSNLLLQIARGFGDNVGYSIASIIAGVSTVFLNVLFLVFLHAGVEGIFYATTIGNSLASVFLIIKERLPKYFSIEAGNRAESLRLIRYSLPLIPNSIIWWVIGVSDRTIITLFIDSSANGIYAVANKFSTILSSIYGIFNLSWTESAALHINDDDKDEFFSKTFNMTLRIFASICLGILAVMPVAFKILVGDGYDEAYIYIPVLVMGMLFNVVVSFIGAIYIAKKKTKQVATTSFWSGVLNIGINLALIKVIGIWAAAFSTLLAFLIMSIYRYIDVQKYVKLRLDKKVALLLLLISSVCIYLYYLDGYIAMAANIALVGGSGIIMNRGAIKSVLKGIKAKFLG